MNILIGGEAGQGLVTIGQLLGKALVRSGYFIVVTQGYQSRIRGGHNTFAIRVGVDEVDGPEEAVDLLVALNSDTVTLHSKDLLPGGLIVIDAALEVAGDRLLRVPFKDLAKHRFSNIAALGVTGSLLGLVISLAGSIPRSWKRILRCWKLPFIGVPSSLQLSISCPLLPNLRSA
jgi:2-oxoglutarate ferredoxin oxidoreductase subunit alpha